MDNIFLHTPSPATEDQMLFCIYAKPSVLDWHLFLLVLEMGVAPQQTVDKKFLFQNVLFSCYCV